MSDYYHQGGVSLVIYKKLINILMKRGEINVKSRNESNFREERSLPKTLYYNTLRRCYDA